MTNFLVQKSELSKSAALMLNKNGLNLSVPHCAYYSCFQYLKHIYCVLLGNDLKTLYEGYKKQKITSNQQYNRNQRIDGLHEFLINQTYLHIVKLVDNATSRTFLDDIGKLKKLRREADYDDTKINLDFGSKSIPLMDNILKVLKKIK